MRIIRLGAKRLSILFHLENTFKEQREWHFTTWIFGENIKEAEQVAIDQMHWRESYETDISRKSQRKFDLLVAKGILFVSVVFHKIKKR